jgi:hypothetical protein
MKTKMSRGFLFFLIPLLFTIVSGSHPVQRTVVSIRGDKFYLNDRLTYEGRTWNGINIEGLLLNSRMVQGIFDDLNPATRDNWKYPDTHVWDPDRNTREFVEAMTDWHSHGLLAFTINIQGGSPTGYGNRGWINPGFYKDGRRMDDYFNRLEKIADRADELGMVVILGIFYFGQDQNLENDNSVINAVNNTTDWIFQKGYRNVLIEISNECDIQSYDHDILKPDRISELINLVKNKKHPVKKYGLYVSASYSGNKIPDPAIVQSSDFILLHGNGVAAPEGISRMVESVRKLPAYTPKPVIFNEDDHYDFDKPENNLVNAIRAGASWGFFDYRNYGKTLGEKDSAFHEGFQSVPVDWKISSERKRDFFNKIKEISGY